MKVYVVLFKIRDNDGWLLTNYEGVFQKYEDAIKYIENEEDYKSGAAKLYDIDRVVLEEAIFGKFQDDEFFQIIEEEI